MAQALGQGAAPALLQQASQHLKSRGWMVAVGLQALPVGASLPKPTFDQRRIKRKTESFAPVLKAELPTGAFEAGAELITVLEMVQPRPFLRDQALQNLLIGCIQLISSTAFPAGSSRAELRRTDQKV